MPNFSKQELKKRSCRRVAEVLLAHYEEGTGAHTRLFEVLIPDEYVLIGESLKGKTIREHIVPCILIRDECTRLYEKGASIEDVALAIEKHLAIVKISSDERDHLDHKIGLKTTMPVGWKFGVDSIFARLDAGGIEYKLYESIVEAA